MFTKKLSGSSHLLVSLYLINEVFIWLELVTSWIKRIVVGVSTEILQLLQKLLKIQAADLVKPIIWMIVWYIFEGEIKSFPNWSALILTLLMTIYTSSNN